MEDFILKEYDDICFLHNDCMGFSKIIQYDPLIYK